MSCLNGKRAPAGARCDSGQVWRSPRCGDRTRWRTQRRAADTMGGPALAHAGDGGRGDQRELCGGSGPFVGTGRGNRADQPRFAFARRQGDLSRCRAEYGPPPAVERDRLMRQRLCAQHRQQQRGEYAQGPAMEGGGMARKLGSGNRRYKSARRCFMMRLPRASTSRNALNTAKPGSVRPSWPSSQICW